MIRDFKLISNFGETVQNDYTLYIRRYGELGEFQKQNQEQLQGLLLDSHPHVFELDLQVHCK